MLSKLIKLPFLKRIVPSLGVRFLKIFKRNRGIFKIRGSKMFLDFLDPIDREIILYQNYEDEEVSYLINLIKKYSITNFFDIGSNCGYYSMKIVSEVLSVKVFAYEPNQEAYNKFNKTIKINPEYSKRLELKNYGLSNKNSSLKMQFLKKHGYNQTGGSSVVEGLNYNKENTFLGEFKVGDEILNFKNQKLCFKIDVEKHELKVLEGLKNTFKNNKVILLIEIYEKNFIRANYLLNEMGLKLEKIIKSRCNYFYSNF